MTGIVSIILALLVVTALIFFHELGHFAAGKLLGFRIDEFAVGMGPTVFARERGGTRYAVRALPIGGMCLFHGEDEEEADPGSFRLQAVWKRIVVVAAGPLMNVLLAMLVSAGILMSYGEFMPGIVSFAEGESPAREAGLMEGDVILSVGGQKLGYYTDCTPAIAAADSAGTEVVVYRGGEKLSFFLEDIYDEESGTNRIGIMMSPVRYKMGLFEAMGSSIRYVIGLFREMVMMLGQMFSEGVQQGDVAGPVGTISILGQAVRGGTELVLRLGVLISVNLALMNILPLPALDGGRLVFLIIEAVRGKSFPPEKEGMIHFAGMVLLLALIVLLTVMDVRNIFNGTFQGLI